ncbi:MAG: ATP-binding protein [Bacteroidota bacterium]
MALYRHFKTGIIIRVVLLCIALFCVITLFKNGLFVSFGLIFSLAVFQIFELIRYVQMSNRELARFLQAIAYEDFSQTFQKAPKNSSFKELNDAFVQIIEKFRRTRAETEEQFRYLQTVVEHVNIGLLVFKKDGEVEILNRAAKRLLHIAFLKNIHDLSRVSPELSVQLLKIRAGEKLLLKVFINGEIRSLSASATEFTMRETPMILVSLQDIKSELEAQEVDSWQKLIRVLRHEMMNSITPIVSLASTGAEILKSERNSENLDDVQSALETIQKRGEGLLNFVDSYRNLTQVLKPNFEVIAVSDFTENMKRLFKNTFAERGISFKTLVEPNDLRVVADCDLIEQILINLLKNATEAVENCEKPEIVLKAFIGVSGNVVIQVVDNGAGIVPEAMDKIFIPFFTTKKSGTGVGLSLSRQIMRVHGGNISVESEPGKGAVFTVSF